MMADTEKITINISVVDLGRIDLLVEQGFYSTRTDFIRTAIRNHLNTHSSTIEEAVTRRAIVVGVLDFAQKDLNRYLKNKEQVDIRVVGMLYIEKDVTPELARATIKSIKVLGVFRASDEVKEALADRILS
jgi:Arc/MetJ-type ribon-helix-helix transcriptional regulator